MPGAQGTEFRVWAPRAEAVAIRLASGDRPLRAVGYGVFEGVLDCAAGADYWVLLDGRRHADPCSRHQPRGLRGPSRVVDPAAFAWTDGDFRGVPLDELVLYELHVGCFTPAGSFDAVVPELERLRALGVTAIELMPVAEFPGRRGWGYDAVYAFAPYSGYGGPDGLARLVDAAHAAGLAVILDVVLNHLGAAGARSFERFGPYFSDAFATPWGRGMNFDGPGCDAVREWAIQSACAWVRDLHLDGLRLDATQAIRDEGPRHLIEELATRVRRERPGALVIAESDRNDPRLIRPRDAGGHGCDAVWADDFHHALVALLTGERDGPLGEFGAVADLAAALRRPFVFAGRWSQTRERRVGAPAGDRPPEQFVVCAQNHDQVGNRALGDRLPVETRPLAALLTLLSPFTPLLFMGEELGEPAPFQFFCDHSNQRLIRATREGRRREHGSPPGVALPDPQAEETFARSRLTRRRDGRLERLYGDLLGLRRRLPACEAEPRFDERARWLVVGRGQYELACNFRRGPARVPVRGERLELATHEAELEGGELALPALAGAVLR